MRTNLSTKSLPHSTKIFGARAEVFHVGQDLYDLQREEYVTVRQVFDSQVGVECRGRYYSAPFSQFEPLAGDLRRERRVRIA